MIMTHKKSDLVWEKIGDDYFLMDKTREFSNLGYVEGNGGFFVAYIFEPLAGETYRELGFFDNAYDAKRRIEDTILGYYEGG